MRCSVCLETYRGTKAPKFLQCGHTFCIECLDRIKNGCSIECPLCKKSHNIPNTESLPTNYALLENDDDVPSTSGSICKGSAPRLDDTLDSIFRRTLSLQDDTLESIFRKALTFQEDAMMHFRCSFEESHLRLLSDGHQLLGARTLISHKTECHRTGYSESHLFNWMGFTETNRQNVQRASERCQKCGETYGSIRTPKILPCRHTFCKICIIKIQSGFSIRCPRCRRSHIDFAMI